MKIQINDKEYVINWAHIQFNKMSLEDIEVLNLNSKFKGLTACYIENENERTICGWSYCKITDNYNKKVGRKLSLTRALKEFDRDIRIQIWSQVLRQKGLIK